MPRTSTVRRAPRSGPRLTLGHALLAGAMILVVTMPFASRALGSVTTAQRNEMVRYAWETDDLTYSAFLARKADFTRAGCNADSPKRGGCTKPKPYDGFVWTTDGCSIPLVKFAYRTLFAGPCEQHDFAYRNIGKGLALDRSNSARKRIDSKLHIEARRVCRDKYSSLKRVFNLAACLDQAEVMWSFFTLPAWGPPKGPENWDKACPRGACWPPAVVDPRPTSAAPGPAASNPAPPVAAAPGPDPIPSGPSGPPSDVPAGSVAETAGGVAHTWTDPASAGGAQGPSVQGGQTVGIACKLQGFRVADGNTWWYRIAQGPWNNQFYVSADAFYNNGATSGSLIGTPFVDLAVPDCPGASAPPPPPPPPLAPTWPETAGGVAHTWTNYANAGGSQGPSVGAHQTVQIACRLQGFRVADGNTWWYRIASSPWNGAYYVSADAFYNNGATSGSLIGTPFVDPAVATC